MSWIRTWFRGEGRSDEEAMLAVRRTGEPAAFGELVRRWEGPIGRLCARMAGEERGENLAQETFVRVFARRGQYAEGKRFSTWVWQIALNVCREEWRRTRRRGEVAYEEGEGRELEPGAQAEAREREALVKEAVGRLAEPVREVVVLREYQGLTFREIGEVLGVPEGTVKWRMGEGLAQLGRMLRPRLGEGAAGLREAVRVTGDRP